MRPSMHLRRTAVRVCDRRWTNGSTLTLRREQGDVPQDIALPGGGSLHPFLGGSMLPWVLKD
jgi:hypothetical protein